MNREINFTIILNYACVIIINLSGILLTPLIINGLGLEQYGLYTLVYSTVMYLTVNEFSVGNIVISNVTKYREKGDRIGEQNFLFRSFIVFLSLAVFAVLVCTLINFYAPVIFKKTFTNELLGNFRLFFNIMSVTVFFQFFHVFFFAVLAGYQKFLFARIVLLVRICIRISCIVVYVKTGRGALSIFLTELVLTVFTAVFFASYAFLKLKISMKPLRHGHSSYGGLAKDIASLYLYSIVDNVYWNIGYLIVAATNGASTVAIFSIFVTFCNIFVQFVSVIPGYFLPLISKLVISDSPDEALTDVMIKVGRLMVTVSTLVAIIFAVVGKDFIRSWIGEDFIPAFNISLITFIALIFPQGQILGDIVIQAKNKFSVRMMINAASALTCIAVSYYYISKFGLKYSYMGLVITSILYKLVISGIYYAKNGLEMKRYSKEVFSKMFPVAAIALFIGYALTFWSGVGIIPIVIKLAAIVIVFALSAWFIYLKRDEKALTGYYIRALVGKLKW